MASSTQAFASLESGDHLTREEFHRRYLTRPDIKKAELVEGVVYVGGRVRKYVVWRVLDRAIDWFRLQDGAYVLVEADADGLIESEQFPGLRLHVASMLAGDLAAVIAMLPVPPDQQATA